MRVVPWGRPWPTSLCPPVRSAPPWRGVKNVKKMAGSDRVGGSDAPFGNLSFWERCELYRFRSSNRGNEHQTGEKRNSVKRKKKEWNVKNGTLLRLVLDSFRQHRPCVISKDLESPLCPCRIGSESSGHTESVIV